MSSPETTTTTTTTTTTYLAAPQARRSYPTRLSLPLSQSPSPSPSPSPSTPRERLGRSTSPGGMHIDKRTDTLMISASSSFEDGVEEVGGEGEEVDRSKLRPRRVHVATTPSPSRRSVPLPPSPSPTPGPSAHNFRKSTHPKHPKARPSPSLLRVPRLLHRRLALSADIDVYDTLIALSFALCLVLFLRALTGSGPESDAGNAYTFAGHQRQAHPAYAPSQVELHRRAGTFCSVPGPISSSASTTHEHDGARIHVHKPHHRTGVPPDPHAHASVDPEGSWSYALDHHLPHLHLHEHDMHGWDGLAKRLMRFLRIGKVVSEEAKEDDVFGMEEEEEDSRDKPEPESLADPHLDDSDAAYPLRVHLPSYPSAEGEKGARDVLTKHKHRKARGRGLVQLRL